jgi:hypothetical protein
VSGISLTLPTLDSKPHLDVRELELAFGPQGYLDQAAAAASDKNEPFRFHLMTEEDLALDLPRAPESMASSLPAVSLFQGEFASRGLGTNDYGESGPPRY